MSSKNCNTQSGEFKRDLKFVLVLIDEQCTDLIQIQIILMEIAHIYKNTTQL